MPSIPPAPSHSPPSLVLDTNVVLDWLVFGNAACVPLTTAIQAGHVQWISTTEMRDELAHVLSRGLFEEWSPDLATLWRTWDSFSRTMAPGLPPLAPRLKCSDPDDQKFIELGLNRARWLITRDRAVLKLSRRAAKLGLHILTPEQWPRHPSAAGLVQT